MFKILVNGKPKSTKATEPEKKLKRAIRFMKRIDHANALKTVFDEIREQLMEDTLNRDVAPLSRTRSNKKLTHYLIQPEALKNTRHLYDQLKSKMTGTSTEKVSINFGYYVNYGKNLEEGGRLSSKLRKHLIMEQGVDEDAVPEFTVPYPIIVPIWNKHKEKVTEQILKEVFQRFKENFDK